MKRLLFAAALLFALPAAAAGLDGTWIGGTSILGSPAYVEVRVAGDGGTLELPERDALLPIDGLSVEQDIVSFHLNTPFGPFTFKGKRAGSVITGELMGATGAHGPMHLVAAGNSAPIDDYIGTYRLPGDRLAWILGRTAGQLRLVTADPYESKRLVPSAGDAFIDGASVVERPVPGAPIVFERNKDGGVVRVRYRTRAGAEAVAERVDGFAHRRVAFDNRGIHLTGTLVMPKSDKALPAVVFVHGSGAATSDTSWIRVEPLVTRGFAVLVYDKRGSGGSSGKWQTASFSDLAGDAAAAMAFLKKQAGVDSKRVGVVGHSQGGWIVPLVLEQVPDAAFAIITSGGAITPADQELFRAEAELKGANAPAGEIEQAKRLMTLKWTYARTHEGWKEYIEANRGAASRKWFLSVGGPMTTDEESWKFMTAAAAYDPAASIARIHVPILLLFGERDDNLPAARAAAEWKRLLNAAGHRAYEIRMLAGARHNFFQSKDGVVSWAPGYIEALARFLVAR